MDDQLLYLIKQFTSENILLKLGGLSALFIIFAAALQYFGRIIGDTKVEKYDKTGYYFEGFFFALIYVLLTLVVAFTIYPYFGSKLSLLLAFAIQILIVLLLSLNFRSHYILRRHGFSKIFKEKLEQKFSEIKRKKRVLGKLIEESEFKLGINYIELNMEVFYEYPIKVFSNQYVLLLFSFFVFVTLLKVIQTTENLMELTGISILTILNLTMIAFAYGFRNAYYPPAKLILDDGTVICGRILKFGEFIHLINGDKKIFVNSNNVKVIEESLFKEVDPCKEEGGTNKTKFSK